jgi:predicted secreted protein
MSPTFNRTAKVGVVAAVALLLLAGCSHKTRVPRAPASTATTSTALPPSTSTALGATTVPPPTGQTIRLADADKGRRVAARRGDAIVVSLTDCFSCGYHWAITTPPDNKVVAHRSTQDEPAANSPAGGSGRKVFTFQAVGAGTTGLTIGYFPPAKGASPETSYSLSFAVSA